MLTPLGILYLKGFPFSVPYPRGFGAGGSSSINSMIYIRGNRRDFDQWEEMGNPGWGYDDLLPFFKKSEDYRGGVSQEAEGYHGYGGPQTIENKRWNSSIAETFLKAGRELGYAESDPNGPEQIGFSIIDVTAKNGRRWSTADAFLKPAALNSPNLHVVLNAHVTKVYFIRTLHRYIFLNVLTTSTTPPQHHLNNPSSALWIILLVTPISLICSRMMYSSSCPKIVDTHLKRLDIVLGKLKKPIKESNCQNVNFSHQKLSFWVTYCTSVPDQQIPVVADVAGVGQNLQDHPSVFGLVWTVAKETSSNNYLSYFNPKTVYDFVHNAEGPLTSPTGTEGVAYVPSPVGDPLWPEVQLALVTATPAQDSGRFYPKIFGYKDEVYKDYYGDIVGVPGFTLTPVLNRPLSRGTLTLASSNPRDHPLINLNFLNHPADVEALIRGIKLALKVGNTVAYREGLSARFHDKVLSGCKHEEAYSDAYWACYTRYLATTAYHTCGTCKMGPSSDLLAVVDHRLRLRGVSGVRVVDASIMPRIISGNTNAPTLMIAEKGAHILREDWLFSAQKQF
nr:oxygen-dependent choline dehydrogenase-like [Cherax quadricarinatus]